MNYEIIPVRKKVAISSNVPTSKSYTNRALLLAALSSGNCKIINPLESDDTKYMMLALKKLGIGISKTKKSITIKGGQFKKTTTPLFLGNAGTGVRFLTAALATQPFKSVITGDDRMQKRPLTDLIKALRLMGAEIKHLKNPDCPPIEIKKPVSKASTKVKGDISSQYLSALLMMAPLTGKTITINVSGKLTSRPYIDMTLDTMKKFGVHVNNSGYKNFTVRSQKYKCSSYTVEGDASSATYPLALSAITGGRTMIKNIPGVSKQADLKFLTVMRKMGCKIKKTATSISLTGASKLKPLGAIDLNELPDAAMTIAIVCAFAKGRSVLKNIGNLRVKESDRLSALKNELCKIGIRAEETETSLIIEGNPDKLHSAKIETYNDHRMAMCFACVGAKVPGIKIENPSCVAKTYPDFWKDLQKWGIKTKKV